MSRYETLEMIRKHQADFKAKDTARERALRTRNDAVVKAVGAGVTRKDVAEALGCTAQRVKQILDLASSQPDT